MFDHSSAVTLDQPVVCFLVVALKKRLHCTYIWLYVCVSESGIGTDISSTDMDYTLKYDHGEYAQTRSPPQFAEFVKPRLLNLEPEFVKPRPVNLAACAEEVQSTDV